MQLVTLCITGCRASLQEFPRRQWELFINAKSEFYLRFCLLLAILMFSPALLYAHEVRPAIATIEFKQDGELAINITLNLEAAIAEIGADHEDTSESPSAAAYDQLRSLSPFALKQEFDRFLSIFLQRISLVADDRLVTLSLVAVDIPDTGDTALPRISELSLIGISSLNIKQVFWRVDPRLGNSVIRLRKSGSEKIQGAEYVLAGKTSGALSVEGLQPQSRMSVFMKYLELGFTHIIPKGLDHILFVVGLFLLSTRLKALLWQITAFTIAHTITLALGVTGTIQLSPAIVEPLIAASIIYVAVENIMTDRLHRWRLIVVFCFGLLHGLGFAGILQEMGSAPSQFILSLLTFNLGVELGQLTVILVCFLTVGWVMKQKWYRQYIVIPSSLIIGLIAVNWVVERIGYI